MRSVGRPGDGVPSLGSLQALTGVRPLTEGAALAAQAVMVWIGGLGSRAQHRVSATRVPSLCGWMRTGCHRKPTSTQRQGTRNSYGSETRWPPGTRSCRHRGDVSMLGVQGPPGNASRRLLPGGGRAVAVPHTPGPAGGTAAPSAQGPWAQPPLWPALQGARCG